MRFEPALICALLLPAWGKALAEPPATKTLKKVSQYADEAALDAAFIQYLLEFSSDDGDWVDPEVLMTEEFKQDSSNTNRTSSNKQRTTLEKGEEQ